MRAALLTASLTTLAVSAAWAQSNYDKTYTLSARPSLQMEVDDASVRVHSCGGCRSVHIHVDWRGSDPSRWRVSEMQGGNGIHFSLKKAPGTSWFGWHGQSPQVDVEPPAETDLNVRSGDGSLAVTGLHGSLELRTGDGSIQTGDTSGPLRVNTGDGSIQVRHADGTLNATTGDGSMNIEGRFTQVDAHTGDGSVQLTMLPGSVLQSSSRITTGDGSVTMRVPGDLRADLDASTGDGSIRCDLPMQSSTNQRSHVHGLLNGGGPSLRLHSGDGSIAISR